MAKLVYQKSVGVGAGYPIELRENSEGNQGWYTDAFDPNLVKQNIRAVLLYEINTRFRQEYFGTRIWEILDEPNTAATSFLLSRFIKDGIRVWEPRVTLNSDGVVITRKRETINIKLIYTINNTNNVYELDFTYNPNTENSNV